MVMPKMGESIMEGTILKWLKKEGDSINEDESVLEVATDKVDTEIPSTCSGTISQILVNEGDIVKVGSPIAIIETEQNTGSKTIDSDYVKDLESSFSEIKNDITSPPEIKDKNKTEFKSEKFFSPLVKNIAKKENISKEELNKIPGSGKDGRVTKQDILNYIGSQPAKSDIKPIVKSKPSLDDQIIELDRMGKIIFDHMSNSKKISAHVQSFVEVDVTNLWEWRDRYKKSFQDKEGVKLTFTPLFIDAVIKSLKDYPILNSLIDVGSYLIEKGSREGSSDV